LAYSKAPAYVAFRAELPANRLRRNSAPRRDRALAAGAVQSAMLSTCGT